MIHLVRPQTFKALQIVTGKTHRIIDCITLVTCKVNRIQVKFVIASCAVIIYIRLDTIGIPQQWIYYIARRTGIAAFPPYVTLTSVRGDTMTLRATVNVAFRLIANSAFVTRITLTDIGLDCDSAMTGRQTDCYVAACSLIAIETLAKFWSCTKPELT